MKKLVIILIILALVITPIFAYKFTHTKNDGDELDLIEITNYEKTEYVDNNGREIPIGNLRQVEEIG